MQAEGRREEREDAGKRESVMQAALQLFAAQGYHGTPVPKIAERAGVGAGTIYRYFESKDALVNELYRRWKAEFLRALSEGYPRELSARERFGFLFRQMASFERDYSAAFAFLEFHHHAGYLDEKSRALHDQAMQFVFGFVESARAEGALNDLSAQAMVAMVFGAFTGLVRERELGNLEWGAALLEETEDALWSAVAARPAGKGAPILRDTKAKRLEGAEQKSRTGGAHARKRLERVFLHLAGPSGMNVHSGQ